ncbi:MAG TPA: arginine--tRNA ligase [Candidatus Saccharimonadales bacterium]|jgi:arginyl-tRNA synthetase
MKQELEIAVAAAVKDVFGVDTAIELTRPDEQFGDYTTNVALQISKQVGKNPREIAQTLVDKLRINSDAKLSDISIAGPGFLNLKLSDEALSVALGAEAPKSLSGQKILVEYSDPNPFKPLHAGHLYTTLVGDTIARLVENAGAETIRLNFGGDVGLHVAKSMWAILHNESHAADIDAQATDALRGIEVRAAEALHTRAMYLGHVYTQGNEAYETDEEAKKQIIAVNKRVYQLHNSNDHDSSFAQIYWTCRQWSYDYFAELYKQLQVVPFARYIPESEVTPLGVQTVQEQLEKGVFERSDGAVVFNGEKAGLHTRVFINSEGIPTYEAKDVGLSLTKWRDYHFDQSVIITANEQEQYMQVVIAAIRQFAPEPAERTRHLTHGVVKLQGGVKMSSRKGNVVTALEILDAARTAGEATGTNPNEETILAAVKYAFAKNRIGGDIVYDPQESIALEGNSGPYLQYAHARARSILAKAGERKAGELAGLQPDERSLLRKITEYPEVVQKATNELMPHLICTYLYELAQVFNRFYERNRVIGDDREAVRIQLAEHYADTLKDGLGLLGITAPDRM